MNVGDDTYLDMQRFRLEVICRGFLAVGTGQGKLGSNNSTGTSFYVYGIYTVLCKDVRGKGPIACLPKDI